MKPRSPVTNVAFTDKVCEVLCTAAAKKNYKSLQWLTVQQARRTFGINIRHNEHPTTAALAIDAVYAYEDLAPRDKQLISNSYPPFFSHGVGILRFSANKDASNPRLQWLKPVSSAVKELLNPAEEERMLYVDAVLVREGAPGLQLQLKLAQQQQQQQQQGGEGGVIAEPQPVYLGDVSSLALFNIEQTTHPNICRGPLRGIALHTINGKRYPQPANDLLVAASIIAGYHSPFWLTEKMAHYQHDCEIRADCRNSFVDAPTHEGMIFALSALPQAAQEAVLRRFPIDSTLYENSASINGSLLLECHAWSFAHEKKRVVNDLSQHLQTLNCGDVSPSAKRLLPHSSSGGSGGGTGDAEARNCKLFVASLDVECCMPPDEFASVMASLIKRHQQEQQENAANHHGSNKQGAKKTALDLRALSTKRFYNSETTSKPLLCRPGGGTLHITGGFPIKHADDVAVLAKRRFLSPLWTTLRLAPRAACAHVLPSELRKGVTLSKVQKVNVQMRVFNLAALDDPNALLGLHPLPDATDSRVASHMDAEAMHLMLKNTWDVVTNPAYLKELASAFEHHKYPSKVWIKETDIKEFFLDLKDDAEPVLLSSVQKTTLHADDDEQEDTNDHGDGDGGENQGDDDDIAAAESTKPTTAQEKKKGARRVLFNAAQTTDPVRVLGVSTYLVRPK